MWLTRQRNFTKIYGLTPLKKAPLVKESLLILRSFLGSHGLEFFCCFCEGAGSQRFLLKRSTVLSAQNTHRFYALVIVLSFRPALKVCHQRTVSVIVSRVDRGAYPNSILALALLITALVLSVSIE